MINYKKIFGIAVVSNDILLGNDIYTTPVNWASKEDQKFYLDKVIKEKPITIMGSGTYDEVNFTHKKSIYHDVKSIILDDKKDYSSNFIIQSEVNQNHYFTSLRTQKEIQSLIEYISNNSNFEISENGYNKQISIAGGGMIYSMFLPFYDYFFLTVERNVELKYGLNLFQKPKLIESSFIDKASPDGDFDNTKCNNIDDVVEIFKNFNMHIKNVSNLSENTLLYEFQRQ